jgi:ferric-chelate reductase (NADPH)
MSSTNPLRPGLPKKSAGLLESTVLKLFTRSGQVLDIEDVGSAFRIATIGGDALRKADWTPGDKVQVSLGGWVQRTYTPLDWDATIGRTRLLLSLDADGPGTQWARTLRKDDACLLFGPRKSIDLTRLPSCALLFGDETSFGLAAALLGAGRAAGTRLFFEVSSLAETQPVLAQFGLQAQLSVRSEKDAHLPALEEEVLAALQAQPTGNIVLSGKASSIQRLSKRLKRSGIEASRFQVKAYWATGKTGLD